MHHDIQKMISYHNFYLFFPICKWKKFRLFQLLTVFDISLKKVWLGHSDLNDQNLFHSTIDKPPGVPGVSKNPEDQTEVHSGELER